MSFEGNHKMVGLNASHTCAMRGTYARLVRESDEAADAYVNATLPTAPKGRLATVARLNWIRRELVWEGESCISAPAVRAAIALAIVALRRRSPDAAARLRALAALGATRDLGDALGVLAKPGHRVARVVA